MAKLNIAVVGLPGKWSTEVLADAVEAKTGFRLVIDMDQVALDLPAQKLTYQGWDLCTLDAIIVKKLGSEYSPDMLDRLELLRIAEQAGVRVFSRPAGIQRLIDRLSCTLRLSGAGIPMPRTRITGDVHAAAAAVEEFGEAVFKPLYSSKARGMQLIRKSAPADAITRAIEAYKARHATLYIQQKVEIGGRDMGLVFLHGEYLGAYARMGADSAWNTTIAAGGTYARADPPEEIVQLASRAQSLFDLSYTTVDIAETAAGPVVFEVSAFGGFRGARQALDLDVAGLYVEHVISRLNR